MANKPADTLTVVQRSLAALKPYPRNPRTHSRKQIHQIATAIREFGFNNPILIDQSDTIIAGHGRLEAARLLGLDSVPTICLEHLSEAQKRAYIIADNKLAENAGWDAEILAIELQHLQSLDLGFELEITGFETTELDLLLDQQPARKSASADDRIPALGQSSVSIVGDVWTLGQHRIICGDSREIDAFHRVMGDDVARLMFTDPPYNVPIDGHVQTASTSRHREFAMARGEMSSREFAMFLRTGFINAAAVSIDGAIHFVCMDWRHVEEVIGAGKHVYSELKNICVWNKDNGGMGSLYRSKHELVFVFKVGRQPHVNTIELGKNGRYRTNVWDYPSVGTSGSGDTAEHPTIKPVALVADAIKDCSRRNDIVLDPFGGSGTTLIAAEKCRRRARLIEIDPLYVDLTIQRWQRLTGDVARLAPGERSFAEIASLRAQQS